MPYREVQVVREEKKVTYFDEAAGTWDEKPSRVELARAVAEAIKGQVPLDRRMRAMEYGCGTGLVSVALAPYLGQIMAADSSARMLEVLEEKLKNLKIENITTMLLDLTDPDLDPRGLGAGFDLIFTSMTLHHIEPVEGLISRFSELLRPGGWLVIADLDREDGSFHGDIPGVFHHGFDRERLKAILSEKGFGRIEAITAHVLRKEVAPGELREYPVFSMRAMKTKKD
jgi:SAM-dependent methyltransferase